MSVMLNKKFYSIIFSVEVLLQLTRAHTHTHTHTHTSMYLHTQTVLYTLWVGCTHTYLCMYVQTHPDKQLRLVRGKNFVFLFFFLVCGATRLSAVPNPLHQPGLNLKSTAAIKQGILGLVHTNKIRKTPQHLKYLVESDKWCGTQRKQNRENGEQRVGIEDTADVLGDEDETLTVRLSRSSCMIKVLSLYESHLIVSSSAMASSKAWRRDIRVRC